MRSLRVQTDLVPTGARQPELKRQLEPRTYGTSAMEWVLPTMGR